MENPLWRPLIGKNRKKKKLSSAAFLVHCLHFPATVDVKVTLQILY